MGVNLMTMGRHAAHIAFIIPRGIFVQKSMLVAAIAVTFMAAMPAFAQDVRTSVSTSQSAPASAKAAQLDKLYADFWEAALKLEPVAATQTGDPRYNEQWPNYLSKQ